MTDRNCMTFDEEDLIKEWRKTSEGKMEWTGRYIKLLDGSKSHALLTDDMVIFDPFGGGRFEFYSPGHGVVVVDTYRDHPQSASISHEDDLRGSENNSEGGSEGSNVSEAPGGSSGLEHLLERYMRHVDRMEGTTFVEALSRMDNDWTCEEWKILSEIRERIVESPRV